MEYRRRERLLAGRSGLCRIECGSGVEWLHCRLIDVSMHGLGIYVQHHSPPGLIGRDVTVDVAPFGDSVNFRLKGSIREATPLSADENRPGGHCIRPALNFRAVHDRRPDLEPSRREDRVAPRMGRKGAGPAEKGSRIPGIR